jgi:hypothetical protein
MGCDATDSVSPEKKNSPGTDGNLHRLLQEQSDFRQERGESARVFEEFSFTFFLPPVNIPDMGFLRFVFRTRDRKRRECAMRVALETKNILVVETRGNAVPGLFATGLFFNALVLFLIIPPRPEFYHWLMVGMSAILQTLLACLAFGPLRDRITVTFHGSKHEIIHDRSFPFVKGERQVIPFDAFGHFELSEPHHQGVCRIRFRKDNKVFVLLRIKNDEEYRLFQHLDTITRKPVEIIE